MCANCAKQRDYEYQSEQKTTSRKSREYQAGYLDGVQAGARKSSQQKKPEHEEHEHGSNCKGCSSEKDEEIVFKKSEAKDVSTGHFVPAK